MTNLFICSSCGTRYHAEGKIPPPTPRWDDGHVCTPVLIDNDNADLKK